MKLTTQELEQRELQLNIEVEPQELDGAMRQAAKKLAGQVVIPGFRKGRAPYEVVVRHFGRAALMEEALDPLTQTLYKQALDELQVEPVAAGRLEDVSATEPLVLRMVVPLLPTVEPGAYRELRLPYREVTVEESDVERELDNMRRQQAVIQPVERVPQMGDQVRLALKVVRTDQAAPAEGADAFAEETPETVLFDDQNAELTLTEEMHFPLPGFGAHLVGAALGESKTVSAVFPEDYSEEDLRGVPITLTFSVQEVREVLLPALDDDFAKAAGEYENVHDLRLKVREDLLAKAVRERDNDYSQEILDALASAAQIVYPPVMLEHEIDGLMEDLVTRVKQETHMELDDYLRLIGKERATVRDEQAPRAMQRLRRGLVLSEISRREKLTISADEIDAEVEQLVGMFGDQGTEARRVFEAPSNRLSIAQQLISRKAIARLVAIAKGEDVPDLTTVEPVAEAAATPLAPS